MTNKPKTYGLTHIAIAVKDLDRTLSFYQKIFDVQVMYHKDNFLQVTTPGAHDIIVFERKDIGVKIKRKTGGIIHFGFRLKNPEDIDEMQQRVLKPAEYR